HQDQAKILFDNYKQAAEKIVSEEEKYEKEIAVCKDNVAQLKQELAKARQTRLICMIFFFVLVPIYFAITTHMKMKAMQAEIDANEQKIAEFEKMHKEIFRDYKVTKLGI